MMWLPSEASLRCYPPLTSGSLFRSPSHLKAIVAQFQVETSLRYKPHDGKTYCATFGWDVSRAMGCELPKDFKKLEKIGDVTVLVVVERDINELIDWLNSSLAINLGWRTVTAAGAKACAAQGKLALAVWKNPSGGHGHIAVVIPAPSEMEPNVWIAQAGGKCFSQGTLQSGFGNVPVDFFAHD